MQDDWSERQGNATQPTAVNYPSPTNIAVQRSLMDIFEEFTVIISGEIKQFEEANRFNMHA